MLSYSYTIVQIVQACDFQHGHGMSQSPKLLCRAASYLFSCTVGAHRERVVVNFLRYTRKVQMLDSGLFVSLG